MNNQKTYKEQSEFKLQLKPSLLKRKGAQRRIGDIIAYIALSLGAIVMIFPFVWMLSTSFKTMGEVRSWPPFLLPRTLSFQNYIDVLSQYPFDLWLMNAFKISIASTLGTLFVCSLAGFSLAHLRFKGRDTIFVLVLASLMLPYQVRMISIFIEFTFLGSIDTHVPLIIPAALANAYGIFLMRQFFRGIPRDLLEAATIDGCTFPQILIKIYIPLAKPALIALALVQFVTSWNDLLAPMLFINSINKMPIALGLTFFKGQGEAIWPWLMSASVISVIPMIIIYVLSQRYIIEGMTFSGLKR